MESSSIRFTAAEGGARLAANAGSQNVLVTEHTSFVATSVLLEHAYMIRRPFTPDRKRSFYITRASRTRCTAHELSILTDLKVSRVGELEDVEDWAKEIENKEVFVCTSAVVKHVLEERIIGMHQINVLIIDSCHLIFKDRDLQYIMECYKESDETRRPRILALTYPLFTPKDENNDTNDLENENNITLDSENRDEKCSKENEEGHENNEVSKRKTSGEENEGHENNEVSKRKTSGEENEGSSGNKDNVTKSEENDDKDEDDNIDDFDMYEKLEWKINELEKALCCKMDLAEDIDSGKRLSSSLVKPKEVIIEYGPRMDNSELPDDYIQLEEFMREAVDHVLEFLNEHRYDPTEIYGDDMYEEFKSIPDPTLEPKAIFQEFLYVLDQLGPYGADKAAFSLLIKLEKLKVKVPYERHFLLMCVCTSVFVKIRCYTESVLAKYDNDWEKITTFLTPKMFRLSEILEQFYQNELLEKVDCDKNGEINGVDEKTDLDKDFSNDIKNDTDSSINKTERLKSNELLKDIDKCDFLALGNKIEDKVNIYEVNLKDYEDYGRVISSDDNTVSESERVCRYDGVSDKVCDSPKFKRQGYRTRGRGRVSRVNKVQQQTNPDALCGVVFVKDPLMAKILFMLIVDMSRSRLTLGHVCAQFCTEEGDAKEHRRHEEVLKKFRMHESNLLVATSVLEEGIDLPRCNLVVRWDMPPSYRSHALCRGRARASRAAVTLFSKAETHTDRLLHHLAIYKELDQIITRKCGCGIQYEPPQEEENHADSVSSIIKSYTPLENKVVKHDSIDLLDQMEDLDSPIIDNIYKDKDIDSYDINRECAKDDSDVFAIDNGSRKETATECVMDSSESIAIEVKDDSDVNKTLDFRENDRKLENVKYEYKVKCGSDDTPASVDLNTAIALINKYCGKLPSDTFTRLTPQWRTERVTINDRRGEPRDAYVCTLRMPLNCPVKYNIVGHPMPTRPLARRMAALLASRALHRAGELDDQLLPIGKENFKAAEMENINLEESGENARPGTTKRRQYYYKRTAAAFTNCRPIVEYTDEDIQKHPQVDDMEKIESRNTLYAIESRLCCALPERYNTRGRRLHAPQHASQAIGILMVAGNRLQIPAFPIYTRSGEVRVRVCCAPRADVRLTDTRVSRVTRFMEFVFSDVLRVRRRGMRLADTNHNNYYVVPTVKKTKSDGSTWIDIDWPFLDLIYQHTEEKKCLEIEKPMLWEEEKKKEEKKGTHIENPLLKPGEVFVFDAEKYKEAVVTPWYRNQDQPQFFLVAEICWNLTPDSSFPSVQHSSFRSYYRSKYGAELTQSDQPLLDVDHTSARLNLLTPRYVNRKGVALPVSSERTRRAKRDRLDQKQILVAELCVRHPFAAPLWCAAVALPCALYRINALLLADELRRAVSRDVGVGQPRDDIPWPPLDFGWSLAEVLNADYDKGEKIKEDYDPKKDIKEKESRDTMDANGVILNELGQEIKEKTINDILQEKEDAESGFEIGTWSNDMASSIPLDDLMEPLPPNVTFCTSSSGGANWSDPIDKPKSDFNPSRTFSMADSDCSYLSSDFDTDDSNMTDSDDDTDDTSGFCSSKNANAAMGVRIEYKTAREAEAVDIERRRPVAPAPQPDAVDDSYDLTEWGRVLKDGEAPEEYVNRFKDAVSKHMEDIRVKGHLIEKGTSIADLLPEMSKDLDKNYEKIDQIKPLNKSDSNLVNGHDIVSDIDSKMDTDEIDRASDVIEEIFPYGDSLEIQNGQVTLESIERNKRVLLAEIKNNLEEDEIKKMHCFSMKDIDIDSPDYVNEKIVNVGFDSKDKYVDRVYNWGEKEFKPYYLDSNGHSGKEFDFDSQPDLDGHSGPSPSVILQALTMSNANDGINLERLETIGDSFLKFAITAYLYCALPAVHEGKLSHMRSKQVSNLNLYRLGRNKRLGERMIASKFEPHDNWLPPCHQPPPTLQNHGDARDEENQQQVDSSGCFIPYNLITQHSIPDKSIADCVEALIGAYLLECGPRGALLFMSWLGITVLPTHTVPLAEDHPFVVSMKSKQDNKQTNINDDDDSWCWEGRPPGSLKPHKDSQGRWVQTIYGALKSPPSPLLRYIEDPEGELERMLSGYDELERTLQYRFRDRSLLLTALTHASCHNNTLTDCYQRLEFLGDAILDYLITRHLYEDPRRHSPGALTDLRSALVNNTIFATLAARHGFHKYFRHMSPGLNEVLTKYVKIQEENGHSISEEHYLIQEDEMEQAEDVEVPKALGDLFESVAGAIFLDSGMSLAAVWRAVGDLLRAELDAFSAAAPKSPVRELLEAEPDTAKFGKPERLADGRRVRVCVEVFGRGSFKGVGRNYRIAKGTAARCALRHLRSVR